MKKIKKDKNKSKEYKMAINSILSIIQRMVSLICGLILPRLFLSHYGSSYNGLVSSITQFLSCIILLNGGVGGVTRAALYPALKKKDNKEISGIINATKVFLQKIGAIFCIIAFLLAIIYPFTVKEEFADWNFVFTLVLILSINNFSQYFFSLTYKTLLIADQKQFINSIFEIIATITSTLFSALLILSNADIRVVKLIAAIICTITAIALKMYTEKVYKIDKKIKANNSAIKQRWDAFGHTFANYIHSNTDIVLLTFFSNTLEMSVYTVHYLAINGVKAMLEPIYTSVESYFGNVMSQESDNDLKRKYNVVEDAIFLFSIIIFSSCSIMITSFVSLFAKNVNDVNYYRPVFAFLACFAELVYCTRIPYQAIIQAAGHFKQTKKVAYFEALLNIIISIIFVRKLGIIGVVMGTLIAMLFRTIYFGIYAYKKILDKKNIGIIKNLIYYIFYTIITILGFNIVDYLKISSWGIWFIATIVCFLSISIIVILLYTIINRKSIKNYKSIILYFKNKT